MAARQRGRVDLKKLLFLFIFNEIFARIFFGLLICPEYPICCVYLFHAYTRRFQHLLLTLLKTPRAATDMGTSLSQFNCYQIYRQSCKLISE